MSEIVAVLMNRDGMTRQEAELALKEAQKNFHECMKEEGDDFDPEEFMRNEFGLEPDYLMEMFFPTKRKK